MSTEESCESPSPTIGVSSRKRRWCQFSLRSLFLVVTVVAACLSWIAYRDEKEAVAVAKLKELGVDVTYETRKPRWLCSLFGDQIGRTAVSAAPITPENAEAAIPYLTALHNLKEVTVVKYPVPNRGDKQYEQQLDAVGAKLHSKMPDVEVWFAVGSGSIPSITTEIE
jgi:hypothetical protein